MSTYTVAFEYTIEDVAGPVEAAERAFEMITDPASWAPIATVTDEAGRAEDIDLARFGSDSAEYDAASIG